MTGWVRVVGLGAGKNEWLTPEANRVLHEATDIVGYFPYVNAVAATVTAKRHASDNGVEVDRAAQALQMAAEGGRVAVVCRSRAPDRPARCLRPLKKVKPHGVIWILKSSPEYRQCWRHQPESARRWGMISV